MLLGRDAERARLAELLARARAGASAALVSAASRGSARARCSSDAVAAAGGHDGRCARAASSPSPSCRSPASPTCSAPCSAELGALPPPQRAALAGRARARARRCRATASRSTPRRSACWRRPPSARPVLAVGRRRAVARRAVARGARVRRPPAAARRASCCCSPRAAASWSAARRPACPSSCSAGSTPAPSAALLGAGGAIAPEVAARLFEATGGNPLALLELSGAAERRAARAAPSRSRTRRRSARASSARSRAGSTRCPSRPAARWWSPPRASRARSTSCARRRRSTLAALEPAEARRPDRDRRRPRCASAIRCCARSPTAPCRRPSGARRTGRWPRRCDGRARGRGTWRRRPSRPTRRSRRRSPRRPAPRARRGGPAAAMHAAERAARLTPEPERRAPRLLEAAGDLARVGRPERAQELLGEALELDRDPRLRADVQHLRALIEARSGAARAAAELLVAEAERVEPVDPVRAAMMTWPPSSRCSRRARTRPGLATARRGHGARRARRAAADARRPAAGDGAPALQRAPDRAADARTAPRSGSSRPRTRGRSGRSLIFGIGQAFMWMEDYDRARRLLSGGIAQARAWSAPGLLPYGLLCLVRARVPHRPLGARATPPGTEAVRLAEETGQLNDKGYALGRARAASRPRSGASASAAPTWRGRSSSSTCSARRSCAATSAPRSGFLELGLGRSEEAVVALEEVAGFLGERPARRPGRAAVGARPGRGLRARTGGATDAERGARRVRARRAPQRQPLGDRGGRPLPRPARRRRRVRGAVPRGARAARHAVRGRADPARASASGCAAPAGASRRAPRCARRWRRSTRLGAQPWAQRARAELRASGERVRRGSPGATERLTPQELQVALEVAARRDQPRGRRGAVPQPEDDRVPPAQHLPQARDPLAHRARAGHAQGRLASPAMRILFVCMGNICRSPTAEGVMRRLLRGRGLDSRDRQRRHRRLARRRAARRARDASPRGAAGSRSRARRGRSGRTTSGASTC